MATGLAVQQEETPRQRLERLRRARQQETPAQRLTRLRAARADSISLESSEGTIQPSPTPSERSGTGPGSPRPADRPISGQPEVPNLLRRLLARFSGSGGDAPATIEDELAAQRRSADRRSQYIGYTPGQIAELEAEEPTLEQQSEALAGEGTPFIEEEISTVPPEQRRQTGASLTRAMMELARRHESPPGMYNPYGIPTGPDPSAPEEDLPEYVNNAQENIAVALQLLRLQRPGSVHPVTNEPLTDEERQRFQVAGANMMAAHDALDLLGDKDFSGVRFAELFGSWWLARGPGPQKRARQRLAEAITNGWVLAPEELQELGMIDAEGRMISVAPEDLPFNVSRDLLEPLAVGAITLPAGAAAGGAVTSSLAARTATTLPRVSRVLTTISNARRTRPGTAFAERGLRRSSRLVRGATEGALTGAALAASEANIRGESEIEAALLDVALGTGAASFLEVGAGEVLDLARRRMATRPEVQGLRRIGSNMRGAQSSGGVDPRVMPDAELDPELGTLDTPTRQRRLEIERALEEVRQAEVAGTRAERISARTRLHETMRADELGRQAERRASATARTAARIAEEDARRANVQAVNDATIARRDNETIVAAQEFREGVASAQAEVYERGQKKKQTQEAIARLNERAKRQADLDAALRELDKEAMQISMSRIPGEQYEKKMKSIARRRAALVKRAALPALAVLTAGMAGQEDDNEFPDTAETGLAALTLLAIDPSRAKKLGRTMLRTSMPREALSTGRWGFLTGLDDLDMAAKKELQQAVDAALRDPETGENLVDRLVNRTNGTNWTSVERPGVGAYGGEVSANTIQTFEQGTPIEHVAQVAALRGLLEGQDAQTFWRFVAPDEADQFPDTVQGFVVAGDGLSKLASTHFDEIMAVINNNPKFGALDGATFDGGHILFKNHSDVSDSEYQNLLADVLNQVGVEVELHAGRFAGDYLDGPEKYLRIVGRNPDALREARRLLSQNVAPVYEQFAEPRGADIAAFRERIAAVGEGLESLARGVDDQAQRARSASKRTGRLTVDDVRLALSKRFRNLRKATIETRTARAVERGVDNLLDWALEFKGRGDWYAGDIARAHATLPFVAPETRDPNMRVIFNAILAITSSGNKPTPNWEDAMAIFRQYVDNGQISLFRSGTKTKTPTLKKDVLGRESTRQVFAGEFVPGVGPTKRRTAGVELGLERVQALIDDRGLEGAVKELRSMIAKGPGKVNRGVMIPAAVRILASDGPKIGRFFANLEGFSDEVTVDVWMKRLWNLWTGQVGDDTVTEAQNQEIRNIITQIAAEASADPRFGGQTFSPSEVQALLWHGIKDLYNTMGSVNPDESFSDAATNLMFGKLGSTAGFSHLGVLGNISALGVGGLAGAYLAGQADKDPELGGPLGVAAVSLALLGVRERSLRRQLAKEIAGRRHSEVRAATDALTGVASRLAWQEALPAAEASRETAVMMFDVGNLKAMNDLVSMKAGDALIARAGAAIKEAAEELGLGRRVFRVGGDEFGVLAPYDQARQISDRAKQIFGQEPNPANPTFTHNLRSGIGNTFDEADELMSAAKKAEAAEGSARFRNVTVDGEQGFTDVRVARVLASSGAAALAGGAIGGTIDDDNPARGAMVGAGLLLASTLGASALGARRARLLANGVTPGPRAALQDANVSRVLDQISWDPQGAPKQPFRGQLRRLHQQIFDDFAAIRRFGKLVGDNRRLSAEATRSRGAAGAAHQRLEDQYKSVLAAVAGVEEEVAALAAAERAIELADNGLGNKLARSTREQQQAAIDRLRQDPRVAAGADKLRAYYTAMLHDKYLNGVITKDEMDAILAKNQLYISFMREADEALETASGSGSVFTGQGQLYNTSSGVKKIREGDVTLKIIDPYRQAIADTFTHEERVAKQRVFQVVSEIVDNNITAAEPFIRRIAEPKSVTAIQRSSVIGAIVSGEKRYYQVLDKDILEALQGLAPESRGLAIRALSNVKNLLRSGVTSVPAFGVANAIRDNVFTALSLPFKAKRAASGAAAGAAAGAAFPSLFGTDEEGDRLTASMIGAGVGVSASQFVPHVARTLDALRGMLKLAPAMQGGAVVGAGIGAFTADEGERTGAALKGAAVGASIPLAARAITRNRTFEKMFGTNEQVREAYEEWIREGGAGFGWFPRTVGDTKRLMRELQAEGVSAEDVLSPRTWWDALQFINRAIEEAPRVARYRVLRQDGTDIPEAIEGSRTVSLDFSRRGSHVRTLAATTAFWNPKLQGWDKIVGLLKDKNTWMVGMSMVTAPTVALWAINSELEEYWQRPQWERNMFWLVPKKLFDPAADGFFRVPKPFEPGFVFASIPERFLDYMHTKDRESMGAAMRDMLETTFDGTLPIPTAVEAIVTPAIGEAGFDMFRQQPVVPPEYQGLSPAIQGQLDPQVSSLAAGISQVLPIQPAKIDNFITDITGTLGTLALRETSQMARSVGLDPRPTIPDAPRSQWERFVTTGRTMSDQERTVLRRFKALGKIVNDADALLERGKGDQAREYIEHNIEGFTEAEHLEGVREALKTIWTARDIVAADTTITNEQKLERLKELRLLASRLAGAGLAGEPLTQEDTDALRQLEQEEGPPETAPAADTIPTPDENPRQRLERLRRQRQPTGER